MKQESSGTNVYSSYTALVIDDSAHMRILLTRSLRNKGFESIEEAENGVIGLAKFESRKPDIVFLDGIMPEMDGLNTLRQIKKTNPESIVVMTTSLSERQKVLEFKEAGANFYLLKPFEDAKLTETLGKILEVLERRRKEGS